MINRSFIQTYYLKSVIFAVVIVFIALVLAVFQMINGYQSAAESAEIIKSSAITADNHDTWKSLAEENIQKEMLWIENQLAISAADSMSLGINLTDSTITLHFKGLFLISSDIYGVYPKKFLQNMSRNEYNYFFGKPLEIKKSMSNVKKREFRKIKVNLDADQQVLDTAVLKPNPFVWEFSLDKSLNFVFFGIPSDTLVKEHPFFKDVLLYRFKQTTTTLFEPYSPTLFIWLSDRDALSIFQALPERPKIIVQN